ncbi:SusC/RagA family TonB-linked outer membrane protein [Marinilongibacter aquaticus]|uniref:SusC/RagA family TonB-linked outer membrane protein n=1 Tax=Marinilongibacter aquaticus TaxID=2975157 RepID=UPI0021BD55BA|nr:SusC/RagA family TonB-linked outer membrane protein [Marinilongibacter aquaticus]UBM60900.1 SusC/RagA family TonB-linked outer membrane protein [Marinilongibacter aquaticus]
MRKKLPIWKILAFSLVSMYSMAQTMKIGGAVVEKDGSPLYGVNVTVTGTSNGTLTDDKGEYSITVSKGETLTFSYVGFVSQDIVVGNSNQINVTLLANDQVLEEVVVTALGIKKDKKALGYAVSEIKGDELTKARTPNMANSLVGKVAGLNISGTATGPGGSSRIVIRGNGSISGNNQPLIVVDGIPISNDNLGSAGMWGGQDRGDGISSLNPNEIESISVLKGATAAALYGSRASNGAILVTTKGGKSGDGAGVEFSSNYTVQTPLITHFDGYQYEYGMGNQGVKPTSIKEATTLNSWGAKLDGSDVIQYDGVSRPYVAQKNNIKDFYNAGSTWNNSLALSGAAKIGTYRVSMNDMNLKGIIPENTLRRQNFAANVNGNFGKRFSAVANIKYVIEKNNNRPRLSDSPGNANYSIYTMPTSLAVATMKESKYDDAGYERLWNENIYVTNPYYAAHDFSGDDDKKRVIAAFEPKFDITDWMFLKGRVGIDNFNYRFTSIEPYGTAYKPRGSYSETNRQFTEINSYLMLVVNKKLTEKFGIDALAGANFMKQNNYISNYGGSNYNIPFFYDITNIDPAARTATISDINKRINSVYGSAEFSYNDYLYLTLTARNDWFSTLAPDKNSILYPSVAASFVLSDAFTMPAAINYLKLRGSWAQAGGDTDPYNLSLYYGLAGAHLGAPLAQINGSQVPNASIQPLLSTASEFGLETKLFNSRLSIDMALYSRLTENDIVGATISQSSGFNTALFNVGKIRNNGIELLATVDIVRSGGFNWELSANYSYNKSEVLNLYQDLTTLRVDEQRTRTAYVHQDVGLPYSQVKGFDYKRNASGDIVLDGQGLPVQGDLINYGTGVPPHILGVTNSFNYKSFNFSFLIDGKFGAKLFSGTNALAARYGLSDITLQGREGGFVPEGVNENGEPNTVNVTSQAYFDRLYQIATPFVYSANFIKLRQIILGYNVPSKYMEKLPFKRASLSVVGRNLAILMKKVPNIDPESTYNNGNAQGLEFTSAPSTRSVGVNLNLSF